MTALSNAEVEDVFPASNGLRFSASSQVGGVDASLDSQLPARTQASGVGLPGHESAIDPAPRGVDAGLSGGRGMGLNRNILALDLATVTGWAFIDREGRQQGGSESFQPRPSWSKGQRAERFQSWLSHTLTTLNPQVIAYEKVIRHSSNDAAHLYGLLEGLVHMLADRRQIPVLDVNVSIIKKEWTGKGNADKGAMVCEAWNRGFRPVDDNHADAIAILDWAVARELGQPLRFEPAPKRKKPPAVFSKRKSKAAAAPQGALL